MRSVEIAIRAAELQGLKVERLVGLDAPTLSCTLFFAQPEFEAWSVTEFNFSDPGPTRNALAAVAHGRMIAFLDADDLFSENWLVEAVKRLARAEQAGEKVIVHPELHWVFDADACVRINPSQSDSIFTPYYFYFFNYYDALCLAPRQAHLEFPYARRDVPNGIGYADWRWSIETMAAGWRHEVAKDTIIFKRRRDFSIVLESAARQMIIGAIEPMAITRIQELGDGHGRDRGS